MNAVEQNTNTGFPGPPIFTWWASQMTQTYRFATYVSLLPGMATRSYLRHFFAEVAQGEAPEAPPEKIRIEKPPSDLEELKQAWQEFEESKGDWSKGR